MHEAKPSRLFAWASTLAFLAGLLAFREYLVTGRVDSLAFRQAFGAFAVLALASAWIAFIPSREDLTPRRASSRVRVRIQPPAP